jgi:putative transposase
MGSKTLFCYPATSIPPIVNRIRARWIWSRGERYLVYGKLDPVKVAWIIREKEKGELANQIIAERMGISQIWVTKLWRRYRVEGAAPQLKRHGRKRHEISDGEKDTTVEAYRQHRVCAVIFERIIDVPHNRIHRVLKEMVMVVDEPRKHARKKWIRYERKYSNSMWRTDWTPIEGMGCSSHISTTHHGS